MCLSSDALGIRLCTDAGGAAVMTTIGTWAVTIVRLDKSKLPYSEQYGRAPFKGEILEKAVGGKLIKA